MRCERGLRGGAKSALEKAVETVTMTKKNELSKIVQVEVKCVLGKKISCVK